ncbi:MAG: alpha/beta hydrolase, partial [Candidatus Marinimicrobia bacterium]|nr:alpha/beta hydrolase [Candidatus Neomarinimicrobiota bacterium]
KDIVDSTPLIIFIHGGSWTKGDKKDYLIYLLSYAEKGYVTASLSYRFAQEEKFPAAVEDIICGIKWLKNHSVEYGIDSNRVAIVGGSAGAHLALMAAYTMGNTFGKENCDSGSASHRVDAVVNFYGPSDLTTDYAISRKETNFFVGVDYLSQPEKYRNASPINYVSKDDPPTMTFIGTLDELVPLNQTNILDHSLKNVNVYHDYHILKGWPHTMDAAMPVNTYTQHYMDKFFNKYLRD